MRVFVLGSSGMLGRYVSKYLKDVSRDVVCVTRKELNAMYTTEEDVTLLGIASGDVVINCVGLIKQRSDIEDLDFLLVNSIFPVVVARVCEEVGANFIHITTDCVFDGSIGSYTESSDHSAIDIYGRSKSMGETENATIIRTSIIGEERVNFLSLLEWVRSQAGKTINGFTNHYWNGITCLTFAKICDYMIENKLFWRGVKHIHSPETVSKFELVNMISEIYDLGISVVEYETPEKCDRSLKSERTDVVIAVDPLYQQIKETKNFEL